MIRFACPGCGAIYAVEVAQAGKTGLCPKCQAQFVIPSPEPAPAPEPPRVEVPLPAPPAAPTRGPDDPVEVRPCPSCGSRLSVLASDLGVSVECPHCKTVFTAARAGATPSARKSSVRKSDHVGEVLGGASAGDRPSRRRRDEDDEFDERPSRRHRRSEDDEFHDDDDRPSRRRRRLVEERPSNIAAVGGMLLGGGIYALVQVAALLLGTFFAICLWPGVYLALVWAILAIIRGSQMLSRNDSAGTPRVLCILQIVLILNCDLINMILGIVGLVLLNSPEIEEFYERQVAHAE